MAGIGAVRAIDSAIPGVGRRGTKDESRRANFGSNHHPVTKRRERRVAENASCRALCISINIQLRPMKQTVRMIEEVIAHLHEKMADPNSSAEAKRTAGELLEYLKRDLEKARAAAAYDV
jgi:hypothetical protein